MMKTKNTKPTQSTQATQSTKKSVAPVAHNADGAKNRKSSFHSIAWNGDEVALRLPAGLLNRNTMTPEELGHVMVVGETGSGKTASTVKPLLGAMFGYLSNDGLRYSALVVDPKHE
ncbi:hypothetical protein, partial [Thiomicrospira microaerophila]|uniref:hypothetical protein n=1 Tax=Thiomicrospira microaerophila TaxID=406020 RepID=UPI0005C8E5F9